MSDKESNTNREDDNRGRATNEYDERTSLRPQPHPQPEKWADLLSCLPDEQCGRMSIIGDPYSHPRPATSPATSASPSSLEAERQPNHTDTYTSPLINLPPLLKGNKVRYIWWHAYNPDGCVRPGQIKSFLDVILPSDPVRVCKSCFGASQGHCQGRTCVQLTHEHGDIAFTECNAKLQIDHPRGVLGLVEDLCRTHGWREKVQEGIPLVEGFSEEVDYHVLHHPPRAEFFAQWRWQEEYTQHTNRDSAGEGSKPDSGVKKDEMWHEMEKALFDYYQFQFETSPEEDCNHKLIYVDSHDESRIMYELEGIKLRGEVSFWTVGRQTSVKAMRARRLAKGGS
ncbi:uncharacterized protein I303_107957 [Kwoniella dejecticola CBS 10117]|uniref:Uncharacterized protein n=1 Tax=Kwoniella dejecticola CBS 10117 TaxID=1296121 RepID=A0A1A5ZW52_9TREE|nr:uncharacterized protein I303_07950 [Kwoniella dejecticola CBS 10117]OBR82036.1 hypothetical protein I303_07950 [Kwoniella dejecticola CBS 10117]